MRGEEGEAREASDSCMLRKMSSKKRVGVEGDGVEQRGGIFWRDRECKYAVEMRLPKKVAEGVVLYLGPYERANHANFARDLGACLRNSTGKEDPALVGGFRNRPAQLGIYGCKESPAVFEGSARVQALCDQYKRLLTLQTTDACKKAAWKEFCEDAKKAIRVLLRSRHSAPLPSSSEVGVSPTPGREVGASMGEGSTNFIDRKIHTAAKILVDMKATVALDKWLEELQPCRIEPETIPVLE